MARAIRANDIGSFFAFNGSGDGGGVEVDSGIGGDVGGDAGGDVGDDSSEKDPVNKGADLSSDNSVIISTDILLTLFL